MINDTAKNNNNLVFIAKQLATGDLKLLLLIIPYYEDTNNLGKQHPKGLLRRGGRNARPTPDTDGEKMTDNVNYIFLELPNCRRALTPDATLLDNICYSLHYMQFLEERPAELRQEIFDLLFKSAKNDTFAPEKVKYDFNMTTERNIHNQIRYAERKGMEEKAIDIARNLKNQGIDAVIISQATGLSEEQIQAL